MSDLVGNPEDRFSRVAAQIVMVKTQIIALLYEPPRWENQPCGFLPGPTQTDLYSHRKELEV